MLNGRENRQHLLGTGRGLQHIPPQPTHPKQHKPFIGTHTASSHTPHPHKPPQTRDRCHRIPKAPILNVHTPPVLVHRYPPWGSPTTKHMYSLKFLRVWLTNCHPRPTPQCRHCGWGVADLVFCCCGWCWWLVVLLWGFGVVWCPFSDRRKGGDG